MAIESELAALKQQISAAQTKKARAEVEIETAQKNKAEAEKTLKEEFKVSTPEQAKALQKRLEAELEKELAAAKESLKAAGV